MTCPSSTAGVSVVFASQMMGHAGGLATYSKAITEYRHDAVP
jgi:hypothetical protein